MRLWNECEWLENAVRNVQEITCYGAPQSVLSPAQLYLAKLVQLQPEPEIVLECLRQPHFKYVTALSAVYVRLACGAVDCWEILSPFLKDFRPLRVSMKPVESEERTITQKFESIDDEYYMDTFIYDLLHVAGRWRLLDISLPHIPIGLFNVEKALGKQFINSCDVFST